MFYKSFIARKRLIFIFFKISYFYQEFWGFLSLNAREKTRIDYKFSYLIWSNIFNIFRNIWTIIKQTNKQTNKTTHCLLL